METFDAIIVGAGIIGLAVAAELSKQHLQIALIEKNSHFGEETSSRNSEVIHAGLYYPNSSLKAELCVEGQSLLYAYCKKKFINHQKIGKLIVANNQDEEAYLSQLMNNAKGNNVNDLDILSSNQLSAWEPNLNGTAALWSPSTGIIDSHQLMTALLAEFESNGGIYVPRTQFLEAEYLTNKFQVSLKTEDQNYQVESTRLINSAGLKAHQVAKKINGLNPLQIPDVTYCRGHYFSLSGSSPFNHLIYPVPETNGAGLGIHATLDLTGQLRFGPDVQYINQIDYDVSLELESKFKKAIAKYYPDIVNKTLQPAYAGIRPKISINGSPVNDFDIQDETRHGIKGLINLFGIESPGLTSCLSISKRIALTLL